MFGRGKKVEKMLVDKCLCYDIFVFSSLTILYFLSSLCLGGSRMVI